MGLFDIFNKKLTHSNNVEKKQKNIEWKSIPVPILTNTPIQGYSLPRPFSFYVVGNGSFIFEITNENLFSGEKEHNENTVNELVQNMFANYINMIGKEITVKSDNMADQINVEQFVKFVNERNEYSEGFIILNFTINELVLTDDSKKSLEEITKRIN